MGKSVLNTELFPMPTSSGLWLPYLGRSSAELGAALTEAEQCERVAVDLGEAQACEVVGCAFEYPADGHASAQAMLAGA